MNRRYLPRLLDIGRTELWLLVLALPILLRAQTNAPPASIYPPNRYLLVVETSHAMSRRSEAMFQQVQTLMKSALPNQARPGDTLGVWTFNEDLYTGLLSLQRWTPENQKAIADRVVGFVEAQKFEKRGRFDKVFPLLNRVVRNSPFITVVLICAGDDEVRGTPFDHKINQFFQEWRQAQLEARTPFVIALRAQAGSFVDCSMNPAPWPAELPPLPKELFVPIPVAHVPATEPRKHATSSVPPLIISGRKHQAPPGTNAAAGPPLSTLAQSGVTNSAPNSPPDSTLAKPADTSPVPGTTPSVQAATTATPAPNPPPPSIPRSPVSENPLPVTLPSLPTTSASPGLPGNTNIELPMEKTTAGKPANSPAVTGSSPVPASTAVQSPGLPAPTQAQSKPGAGQPAQPTTSDANPSVIQVAAVGANNQHVDRRILWAIGFLSLGALVAAVWIWRRRTARAPREISLITESIDRRKH